MKKKGSKLYIIKQYWLIFIYKNLFIYIGKQNNENWKNIVEKSGSIALKTGEGFVGTSNDEDV